MAAQCAAEEDSPRTSATIECPRRFFAPSPQKRLSFGIRYRVRIGYVIRSVCVFIGAVVGAGFATGREIIVFFGDFGVLSPVLAGVLMGAFGGLFMYVGRALSRLPRGDKHFGAVAARLSFSLVDAVSVLATVLIFATMVCGLEQLLFSLLRVRYLGLAAALLCVAATGKDLRGVGAVNVILVPVLAFMIVYLAVRSDFVASDLPTAVYPSLSYCAMNMLLGGMLIAKDASAASSAEICAVSAICGCVMAAMLAGVYCVSMGYADFAMPIFEFCKQIGAGTIGAAMAVVAIVTTLVGAAKTLRDGAAKLFRNGVSAACAVALLAFASARLDFAAAVDAFYPFIGAAASAVMIAMIPIAAAIAFPRSALIKLPLRKRFRKNK